MSLSHRHTLFFFMLLNCILCAVKTLVLDTALLTWKRLGGTCFLAKWVWTCSTAFLEKGCKTHVTQTFNSTEEEMCVCVCVYLVSLKVCVCVPSLSESVCVCTWSL